MMIYILTIILLSKISQATTDCRLVKCAQPVCAAYEELYVNGCCEQCRPKKCQVLQCLVAPCPDSCGDGAVCESGYCKPDAPVFCTKELKRCPDGSGVGRDSNNNCEFFPCPPDCSAVRCGAPNCALGEEAYTPKGECCQQCRPKKCQVDECLVEPCDDTCGDGLVCENGECKPDAPVFCIQDAKKCPDGSSVGRDSNNNCEFFPCPLDCRTVLCPQILCALGFEPYTPKGECCDKCRKIDCYAVLCPPKPVCGANEELYVAEGECCPKCKTDCTAVLCMKPLCTPSEVAYTPQGECCEQCKIDCSAVLCLVPKCTATEELYTPDGSCCPKCKPIDTPPTCKKGKRACAANEMVVRDPNNNCKFPKCSDGSKACPSQKCRNANGKCERGTYVQSIIDPCKENNGGCGTNICTANYCNGATAVCEGCNKNECEDATGTCVRGFIANCITAPCQIDNGGCGEGELCGDNYCNGCNAVCSKCPTDGYCINTLGDCVEGTVWNTFADPCQFNNGGCGDGETCEANYCNGATTVCKGTCATGRCLNPNGICDHQVACKMDPCQIDNGGCGNKKCKANYCGGCNAVCDGLPVAEKSVVYTPITNKYIDNHHSYFNTIVISGFVLFILINTVFIGYWCVYKDNQKHYQNINKVEV